MDKQTSGQAGRQASNLQIRLAESYAERERNRDEIRRLIGVLRTRLERLVVSVNEYAVDTSRAQARIARAVDRLDLAESQIALACHTTNRYRRATTNSNLRRDYLLSLRTDVTVDDAQVKRCN